jgi:osmoprotectant transport system ATP-binding protein
MPSSVHPIAVENIAKSFAGRVALAPSSIAFRANATTVLIGPSGCGKSTLLRILLGLVRPDSGRVLIDGVELSAANVMQLRHRIGYVIQDGGLFPHLSAKENVTLLARYLERTDSEMNGRVAELADLTQIPVEILSSYPSELSGGQRQRVGLMRALMLDPDILLLDEPLGALDPITRHELQAHLKAIFTRLRRTAVLVTHDMNEAAYLADEIVLMRAGSVVQQGSLTDLLQRPKEDYVTEFIRAQRSSLPPLTAEGRPAH